jgi:hypothetical protein
MAPSKTVLGWVFLALAVPYGHAQSQVYKCPDANGRPTYTNVKRDTVGKKCTLVSKEKVQTYPSQTAARDGARDRSPVDRNLNRRKILESELQNEQQLLSDAQQKLTEQEGVRKGDERNYARVQERLKPFQEAIDLHTKNIEQLRGELGRVK